MPETVTPEEIVRWCREYIDGKTITDISRETGRARKTVSAHIFRNLEWVRKMDEELKQDREPSEEEPDEGTEQGEPDEGGGEEPVPPPSEPPLPPETRVVMPPRRRGPPRRFVRAPRPRPHPTYEEADEFTDEEEEAPVFKGPEATLQKRRERLSNMLKLSPKITRGNANYVLTLCQQDSSLLADPRNLYELLIELDGVNPKLARRITDVVFAVDNGETGGYDPYQPRGYIGTDATSYYPAYSPTGQPYSAPPYGPAQHKTPYDPIARDPRMPPNYMTQDQVRDLVERERRLTILEQENQRLRNEMRLSRERNIDRTDLVKIRRPIRDHTGTIIDYEEEEVPRDIYLAKMEQERTDRMLKLVESRQQAIRPEPNEEIKGLRVMVEKLQEELRKKEKDEALARVREDLAVKLNEANRNFAELMRITQSKLERLEAMQNQPSGTLSDDAQVLIAEIKHSSDLTRTALLEVSKTLNNAIEAYNKAARPARQREGTDRRHYKEDLDAEEIRVIEQEFEEEPTDSDVEEG